MARAAWMIAFLPAPLLAQQAPPAAPEREEPVFVEQAEGAADPAASPVYWPERITRERVEGVRATAAQQVGTSAEAGPVAQLTTGEGARTTTQLSAGDSGDPLAQLTESERQVLLDAIEGTDICAREAQVAAIRQLCAGRLETRSAEFRRAPANTLSPEERLLGEGIGGNRVASLERIIERLGRTSPSARDAQNQAIASMALNQPDTDPNAAPADPDAGLSEETRVLIEAIVNQVPGPGGP